MYYEESCTYKESGNTRAFSLDKQEAKRIIVINGKGISGITLKLLTVEGNGKARFITTLKPTMLSNNEVTEDLTQQEVIQVKEAKQIVETVSDAATIPVKDVTVTGVFKQEETKNLKEPVLVKLKKILASVF